MNSGDDIVAADDRALAAFLRIGSMIGMLDETELYPHLLDAVFEVVPAKHAAIILASDDGGRFLSGIYRKRGLDVDAEFVPSSETTRGVLETGAPIRSNEHSPPALCALMRTRTRKLGVIYAEAPLVESGFAPKHLKYIVAIAGLASGALRQAKSVEDNRAERPQPAVFAESGFAAASWARELVGESSVMLRLYDQVRRAGRNDCYVLILGEPGTGKELVARAIHRASRRSDKTFLAVNCASIPAETMESQMFGYEKGSFTGAVARQIGWVEVAKGGTLFLDEIGDMPLTVQPKLLRFLQEKEFMRLGGKEVLQSDVRIVAATNRDLERMVNEGLFRQDLLNRLDVFTIKVPPLRQHPEDILALAWHFIKKNTGTREVAVTEIDPEVQRLFCESSWPGNVRRLENTIISALANGDPQRAVIVTADLPDWLREPLRKPVDGAEPSLQALQALQARKKITRQDTLWALEQTNGHHEKAARLLGISRAQLFRLKKRFDVR